MQGLLAIALTCLLVATVAQNPADEAAIQARKKAIDQAANKAEKAAELAMAEARQEEAEEKVIEASTGLDVSELDAIDSSDIDVESSSDVVVPHSPLDDKVMKILGKNPLAQEAPALLKEREMDAQLKLLVDKKFKGKSAAFKKAASARLKKVMQRNLAKRAKASQKLEAKAAVAHKKQMAVQAVALKKHRAEVEKLKWVTEVKRAELARIEEAEDATRRKVVALKQRKAEEMARLKRERELKKEAEVQARVEARQALKRKATERKVAIHAAKKVAEDEWDAAVAKTAGKEFVTKKDEVDLDAFIHKAVAKKFGSRLSPAALKRAEVRMKNRVKTQLKKKAMSRQQHLKKAVTAVAVSPRAARFDLEAWVQNAIEAKFKNIHMDAAKVVRLKERMGTMLRQKYLASHPGYVQPSVTMNALPDMPAPTAPKVDVDAWVKKLVAAKLAKTGKHLTKAQETHLRKVFEKKLQQRMKPKHLKAMMAESSSVSEAKVAVNDDGEEEAEHADDSKQEDESNSNEEEEINQEEDTSSQDETDSTEEVDASEHIEQVQNAAEAADDQKQNEEAARKMETSAGQDSDAPAGADDEALLQKAKVVRKHALRG